MKTMISWCCSVLEEKKKEKKKGGTVGEQGGLGNGRGQLINNRVGLVTSVLVTVACLCSVSTALDVEPCQTWSTESNALPSDLLLATDSTRYTPYARLRVTITGVFNRMVMQARVIGSSNGTVGIFTDLPDFSETHRCEANQDTFIYDSVTNINSLVVTWIAPARSYGDIELVARVSTEGSNSWWTVTSLVIHDNVSLYADHLGTNFSLMLMDIDGTSYQPEVYIITPSTVPVEVSIVTGFQTHHSSFLASSERPWFDRLSTDSRLRSSTLERQGLSISASDEIGAVVVNKEEYSIDGFLSLPHGALGNEYFAVSYSPSGSHHSQIGAVPTEDGTVVSFALPPNRPITVQFRNRVYNSGRIITVRMNLLDAIQIQSNDDLTGTRVYSNKPIAVFSGNDASSVGGHNSTKPDSTDHMVEQLVPVKSWGQTFAVVPFPDRTNGNIIRIVASEWNTSVMISSDLTEILLNPGDFVDVEIHSEVYYWLESNKPVQVVQFSKSHVPAGSIGDTAMSLQPPVDQQSNDYRFITPDGSRGFFDTNYMLIVIEETHKDGIYIEGIAFGEGKVSDLATWKVISGSKPAMVATAVKMKMDVFHVYHETNDVTFQLVLTGHSRRECYALPIGLRLYDTNVKECVHQPQSVLDGIDNDCDGEVDEEECDKEDDDGDGYVDEDCSVHITTASMEETSEVPFTTDVSSRPTTHHAGSLKEGEEEDDKFSLLELCAMGAGGLLFIIICIVLLVCCLRKCRNRDRPNTNETEMGDLPSRSPSVTASMSTISHGDGRGTSSLGQAPSILSSGYHSDVAVEEEEEEFETIYPTDDFQESEHSDGTVETTH